MSRSKWRRAVAIAVGVLLSLVGWVATPLRRPADLQVTTAPISAGSIVRHIMVNGTLIPMSTVDVGTQISGTVQSIDADFNDVVHVGQVLLRLDDGSFRAALQQARSARQRADADLSVARTTAEQASQKLSRATDLAARDLLPRIDLDAARTDLAQAESDVQAAETVLDLARAAVREATVNLGLTVIRAPASGVVVDREINVGVTVAALQSAVLFRLATDFTHMEVQANVDESDIAAIRSGQTAIFDVSAYPNEVFKGRVAEVRLDPVRDAPPTLAVSPRPPSDTAPAVVMYPVIITVDNADEKLRPGMTAIVSLDGPRRDAVVRIPNSALSFTPPPQVLASAAVAHPAASDGAVTAALISGEPSPGAAVAHAARVWEYDGAELTPVDVQTGLADDAWTELVKGPIGPGIALVTHAEFAR
jgi:HlyD family secretion protein